MSEVIELKKINSKSTIDCFEFYAIYSENIQRTKTKEIPKLLDHLKWWFKVFETEDLYLIKSISFVIGYIRIKNKRNFNSSQESVAKYDYRFPSFRIIKRKTIISPST